MSNIDKRALRKKLNRRLNDAFGFQRTSGGKHTMISLSIDECKSVLVALDELEAKDKRLNEILKPNMLLPVIDDMDVDNLRHVIKTASENYSLLHAKWEASEKRNAELSQKADIYDMLRQDYGLQGSLVDFVDWQAKRIAELEAREVTLPQVELVGYGDWPMFDANLVTEALRTAGISIATAGKGA